MHEPTNHFLWCQWDKLQPKPLNEFGSLSPCQKLQNRHNLIECNPKKKKKVSEFVFWARGFPWFVFAGRKSCEFAPNWDEEGGVAENTLG